MPRTQAMQPPYKHRAVTVNTPPPETTVLPVGLERLFQQWVLEQGVADADSPHSKYDYRGAFMDGLQSSVSAVDGAPHWPDTYKRHGHPSFSVESKYSTGPFDGGAWGGADGETYLRQLPKPGVADAVRRR